MFVWKEQRAVSFKATPGLHEHLATLRDADLDQFNDQLDQMGVPDADAAEVADITQNLQAKLDGLGMPEQTEAKEKGADMEGTKEKVPATLKRPSTAPSATAVPSTLARPSSAGSNSRIVKAGKLFLRILKWTGIIGLAPIWGPFYLAKKGIQKFVWPPIKYAWDNPIEARNKLLKGIVKAPIYLTAPVWYPAYIGAKGVAKVLHAFVLDPALQVLKLAGFSTAYVGTGKLYKDILDKGREWFNKIPVIAPAFNSADKKVTAGVTNVAETAKRIGTPGFMHPVIDGAVNTAKAPVIAASKTATSLQKKVKWPFGKKPEGDEAEDK